MKKLALLIAELIILLVLGEGVLGEVKINEVELNPDGKDSGNEWIELYSNEEIDLGGWKLVNNDNDSFELNQTFQGFFIINLKTQWLDNKDEKIFLYNGLELIDETDLFSDSADNDKTWAYCVKNWTFADMTKNSANSCGQENEKDADSKNIEIIEKETEKANETTKPKDVKEIEETKEPEKNSSISGKVVHLGEIKETGKTENENAKTKEEVIYESGNEMIKKYAVFGFALLCVILSVLLVLNKLN